MSAPVSILEFMTRRLWCMNPAHSLEDIAATHRRSTTELQAKLSHIPDLSYRAIVESGLRAMAANKIRDGRIVGFLDATPSVPGPATSVGEGKK